MRLHARNYDDKMNAIQHALAEIPAGRIYAASLRIADVEAEFPDDDAVLYARGMFCRDHFGEGLAARDFFQRAFEHNPTNLDALCNAAGLAPTQAQFEAQAEAYLAARPNEAEIRKHRDDVRRDISQGTPYWEVLATQGLSVFEADPSCCAAFLEVALLEIDDIPPDRAAMLLRTRAQALRELDVKAETALARNGERYPARERFLLQSALTELERAIELDPAEPELHNLRAAWLNLLDRPEDALVSADRAIELDPSRPAKPLLNRAVALWTAGHPETLAAAKAAITAAQVSNDRNTEEKAQSLAKNVSAGKPQPTLPDLMPKVITLLQSCRYLAEEEARQQAGNLDSLVRGVGSRFLSEAARGDDCTCSLAELLSDLSSDTVAAVFITLLQSQPQRYGFLFESLRRVVLRAEDIYQLDALRVLRLLVLAAGDPPDIAQLYREEILMSAAKEGSPHVRLPQLFAQELDRVDPDLKQAIEMQTPTAGSSPFADTIQQETKMTVRPGPGCGIHMIILTWILLIIAKLL